MAEKRHGNCARVRHVGERQKQVKQEEDELKGRTDTTRQKQENNKWEPISGHQTRTHRVGESML